MAEPTGTTTANAQVANADANATEPNAVATDANANNSDDNVDNFKDLWNNSKTKETETTPTTTVVQQVEQQPSSAEVLETHIKGLDLTNGIDTDAIVKGLAEGDTTVLAGAFAKVSENTYKAILPDVNRLMDSKVKAAVEAAVGQAGANYKGDQLTGAMHTALPFTKDPSMAPIASAVLAKFTEAGKTQDEAIESVRAFFAHAGKLSAKAVGIAATPNTGQFRDSNNGAIDIGDETPETDWVALLSG